MNTEPTPLDIKVRTAVGRFAAGRAGDAEALCLEVLQSVPDHVQALHLAGVAAYVQGQVGAALGRLERAAALAPDDPAVHSNRGLALQAAGRADAAADAFRRSLALSDVASVRYNLGNALRDAGQVKEALDAYRDALDRDHRHAGAHDGAGLMLQQLGRDDEAVAAFDRALAIDPNFVGARINLGNSFLSLDRLADAEQAFRMALAIDPRSTKALGNLGLTLREGGDYEGAAAVLGEALKLDPRYAKAWSHLAMCLRALGRIDDALAALENARTLSPKDPVPHTMIIGALSSHPAATEETLFGELRRFARTFADPLAPASPPQPRAPDPDRPLRIGYLSADFRTHAAAHVFGSLITDYDRASFEVFCYANDAREDHVTARFRDAATAWRPIMGLSDTVVADGIGADGIDILVDLSGHTAGNRPLVLARKPAPIQVTGLGYPLGTGMAAVDYLFSDPITMPAETRRLVAEQVWDLPCAQAYIPVVEAPPVAPGPAGRNGFVTFGCFSRLVKVTPAALALWAEILGRLPDSRLVMKDELLDHGDRRAEVERAFTDRGVDPARLTFHGRTGPVKHMAAHGAVDLTLDPFPLGGSVTTLESLWMGVPVLTIRGHTVQSRLSASILEAVGLPEFIAEDAQGLLDLAVSWSGMVNELSNHRSTLRDRVGSTFVGNSSIFVRTIEEGYREMWRRRLSLSSSDGLLGN